MLDGWDVAVNWTSSTTVTFEKGAFTHMLGSSQTLDLDLSAD